MQVGWMGDTAQTIMSTRAPAVLKNTAEDVALGARVFNGVNFFETSITRINSLSSLMSKN